MTFIWNLPKLWNLKGESDFADDLSDRGLLCLLQRPILIVVDEFQRSFFSRTTRITLLSIGKPTQSGWLRLGPIPGRLLLISSREVDATERWAERSKIKNLSGLTPEDGAEFLTQALTEKGMPRRFLSIGDMIS